MSHEVLEISDFGLQLSDMSYTLEHIILLFKIKHFYQVFCPFLLHHRCFCNSINFMGHFTKMATVAKMIEFTTLTWLYYGDSFQDIMDESGKLRGNLVLTTGLKT